MKRLITRSLLVFALAVSASAEAAFIGDFASGNWTSVGPGSVIVNSPTSITLSDEVDYVSDPAQEPQIITFDIDPLSSLDICLNGVCDTYTDPTLVPVSLNPGDVVAVSNPQGRNNVSLVPEPATPALLGAGLLLGLALFGRRKSA